MKIKHLIKKLKDLDPEAHIVSRWIVVGKGEPILGYSRWKSLQEIHLAPHPTKDYFVERQIGERAYVIDDNLNWPNESGKRKSEKGKSRYQIAKGE